MKAKIMRLTNALLSALDSCYDEDLVDEVCARVSSYDPFDEDDIARAENEEVTP